jgi:2-polyprenyl-3-methyl-5-hydroxy-6-metoxy-1,4-benzoquinol methylase
MNFWNVINTRRSLLKNHFNIERQFEQIEESCIPSYTHSNLAAASVSWWRLASAAKAYRRHCPEGPILDFGAASGELFHVLQPDELYHFVELNDKLTEALIYFNPEAIRQTQDSLSPGNYGAVFALDSLEHNHNIPELLERIHKTLRKDGLLILSGPTENWIYRLGRRLAGFSGHYHTTNIGDIEMMSEALFSKVEQRTIPLPLAPLFNITVWKRKQP